jgi:biotin operon repressor
MARRRKLGRAVDKTGRSKGGEQYAPLPYALLQSPAWRSLSGAAVKVFLELRTRFHGANNGRLTLSLEEAKRLLGLGKTTVQRALEELQVKGLIICTRKGQWYGRLASTWATTDRPSDSAPATNNWKTWQPPRQPAKRSQKTECGPEAGPSGSVIVPFQDRRTPHGSVSGPVRPFSVSAMGPETGR